MVILKYKNVCINICVTSYKLHQLYGRKIISWHAEYLWSAFGLTGPESTLERELAREFERTPTRPQSICGVRRVGK